MSDVTAGYTFTSGEKNVTHTKLNSLGAGTVAVNYHTDKAACDSNPAKAAHEVLVYDTVAAAVKKGSLSKVILDSTELLSGRTAKTAPTESDLALIADAAAANGLKKITLAHLFSGAVATAGAGSIVGTEKIHIVTAGGVLQSLTLAELVSLAAAESGAGGVAGTEKVLINDGGTLKSLTLTNLITLATAATVPAAADEWLYRKAADGALQKITWANALIQILTGAAHSGGDVAIPATGAEVTFDLTYARRAYRLVLIRTDAAADANLGYAQNEEVDLHVVSTVTTGVTAAFVPYFVGAVLHVLRASTGNICTRVKTTGVMGTADDAAKWKIRCYL